jgi:hypothetical protein
MQLAAIWQIILKVGAVPGAGIKMLANYRDDQTCLADFGPNACAANKQPNASSPKKMRNTARAYDH